MAYRRSYGSINLYAWDDGTRPSLFSPWPGLKAGALALLGCFGILTRVIDPWVLTLGICFVLYFNDRWETAITTRKS
jgi:hypothetical protein